MGLGGCEKLLLLNRNGAGRRGNETHPKPTSPVHRRKCLNWGYQQDPGVSANSFSTRKEWFVCSLDSGFRVTVNYTGDGGSWLLISNPNRTKLDKLSVINYWEYTTTILSVF